MAVASSTEDKFQAAVKVIRSLPKNGSFQPSHELMLRFYGFFKQATEGKCDKPKPGFWDVVNKAKWDAWNKLGAMPREEAMTKYVEELKKIVETMPQTNMVAEFVEKLGSFYEIVEEGRRTNGQHPHSDLSSEDEHINGVTNGVNGGDHRVKSLIQSGEKILRHRNQSAATSSSSSATSSPHRDVPRVLQVDTETDESGLGPADLHVGNGVVGSLPAADVDSLPAGDVGSLPGGDVGSLPAGDGSDGDTDDEFCDTTDQPVIGEETRPSSGLGSSGYTSRGGGSLPAARTRSSQQHSRPPQHTQPDARKTPTSYEAPDDMSASGRYPGGHGPPSNSDSQQYHSTSDALAAAVIRLQQDVSVLSQRLSVLESTTLQAELRQSTRGHVVQRSDWFLETFGVSARTALLLFGWPVLVNVICWFIRNRRITRRR